MNKIYPLYKIMRLHNCLGGGLATLVGVYLVGGRTALLTIPALLAIAVVCLILAGNNVVNDICDFQVDCLQKPERMLPSGRLCRSTAIRLVWVLFASGLILAFLLKRQTFLIALGAMTLGIMYSVFLKNSVLVGNATVGVLCGLAVIYGGLAVSGINGHVWVAAGIVGGFMFIREILKSIADLDGDLRAGITTVATRLGSRSTLVLTTGLAVLFVLGTALPWLVESASARYLLVMFLGVNVPLLVAVAVLWKKLNRSNLHLALRITKFGWFLGLFALSNLI